MPRYREMPHNPDQLWLLPPSLDELVGDDCDVRLLNEVMNHLDWSILESDCLGAGRPCYPPKVMAKILIYAYSKGIRSSRRIEELTRCDVRYMWLTGGHKPDFHTIAKFRKDNFDEFAKLFADSVRVCKASGLVPLNVVSVDGTKVIANASKASMYNDKRVDREIEAVERILREAEEADNAEDALYGDGNGSIIPDDLKDAKKRREKLKEIAAKLKASKSKSISSSDDECRMMKTRNGVRPAYNVQAAVDSKHQIIVAAKVVQGEHDHRQLADMLVEVKNNTGLDCCLVLADTGYCDEATLLALNESGQEALIPPEKHSQESKRNDLFCSRCFVADDNRDVLICPAGRELTRRNDVKGGSGTYKRYRASGCGSCSMRSECVNGKGSREVRVSIVADLRDKMVRGLKSPAGKEVYRLRGETVEPVFGQVKHDRKLDRLYLNGINGAEAEVMLAFLAHNLLKCARWGLGGALSAILKRMIDAVAQLFVKIMNMFRVADILCPEALQY